LLLSHCSCLTNLPRLSQHTAQGSLRHCTASCCSSHQLMLHAAVRGITALSSAMLSMHGHVQSLQACAACKLQGSLLFLTRPISKLQPDSFGFLLNRIQLNECCGEAPGCAAGCTAGSMRTRRRWTCPHTASAFGFSLSLLYHVEKE
jgi:hypothetical protein